MIYPRFPRFQKVRIKDKNRYETFFKDFDPYCDFSFNDLMIWLDHNEDLLASEDDGNLVLRFSNPFNGNRLTYSVIGKENCDKTIEKIFTLQKNNDLRPVVEMVPEVVIQTLELHKADYEIREETANRDYIYCVAEVHDAEGRKFANHRHRVNHFIKEYPNATAREINLLEQLEAKAVLDSMHRWLVKKPSMSDKTGLETKAIEKYVANAEILLPKCIGIFEDGELVAFSIFHLPPQGEFSIGNHIKCASDLRYLFDFAYAETIKWLHGHNIKYINGEQDLGIVGLRTHKQEMGPCSFLRRYTIRPSATGKLSS